MFPGRYIRSPASPLGRDASASRSSRAGSRRTTRAGRVAVVSLALAAGLAVAPAASADSPPSSWTNERIITCDGKTVHTYLTPAGFGTPFHVVGSTDVIIPKYVEVTLPNGDGPFVTMNVRGFNRAGKSAVHCTYVDPIGLEVDFWGLRK